MNETWRDRARPIIAEVLRKHAGSTEKERRKALREAYPFGVRAYWPYKVWLDEIRRQTGQKALSEADKAGQTDWLRLPGGGER